MSKSAKRKLIALLFFIIVTLFQTWQHKNTTDSKAQIYPTIPFVSITPSLTKKEYARVVKVVDGDTIEVIASGESIKKTVRYIGIDTPETVHPKKAIQCYGKEASNKNKDLVMDRDVYMIRDISETDKYGRLLRYVYIQDPTSSTSALFVNEYLVKEGYAYASTFPPDVAYQELFRKVQEDARIKKLGLWTYCS